MQNYLVTLLSSLAVFLSMTVATTSSFGQTPQTLENNRICNDPIVAQGVYVNPVNTGLCIACGASGSEVRDGDLNTFSTLTLGVAALGTGSGISIRDSLQYYPGGNRVGFVIQSVEGLLDPTVLGNFQIRTYRNGVLVQTSNSGIIQVSALGGSGGKQMLSFITGAGQDFDEVQLFYQSGGGLCSSIRVYYAFEGPASCSTGCFDAITTADYAATVTSGEIIGSQSLSCDQGGVSQQANVIDPSDTTGNFGLLTSVAGLACARFIQVQANEIFPAGTEAGFLLGNTEPIDTTVLGGITISTYNGTALQESFSGVSLLTSTAIFNSQYRTGFKTTQPFNAIRISLNGTAVAVNLRVYHAYIARDTDNDGLGDCLDACVSGSGILDSDGDGLSDGCDMNASRLLIANVSSAETTTVGETVSFTITVSRQDTSLHATGVVVRDSLPAGLTPVSFTAMPGTVATSTAVASGHVITWTIGSYLGGTTTSASLIILATVDSIGVNTNYARIAKMNEIDPNLNDNSASDCVTVPIHICEGRAVTLTASTTATDGIQWFKDGGAIPEATTPTYLAMKAGAYTYTTTGVSTCATGNCCPIIVTVDPTPMPVINASSSTVCAGGRTTLTVDGSVPMGATYLWSNGSTSNSIMVAPDITTTYSVTVTNPAGCSGTATTTITVNPVVEQAPIVAVCGQPSSNAFVFTINPSTTSSGTQYTVLVNGGTSQLFTYGSAQSFTGLSTLPITLVITDVNSGCSITRTVTAPVDCPMLPICVPITVTRRLK